MMEFPKSVEAIVDRAAKKFPSDISKAIDQADKEIRKLPEFDELVSMLIRKAVAQLIYDARHSVTNQIKRDSGMYGGPAKVIAGLSKSVNRVAESIYAIRIAGTMLGELFGRDLPGIADSEMAIGHGHLFNARLCQRLAALVPEDKRVQEAVKEKKLQAIFLDVLRDTPEAKIVVKQTAALPMAV